MTQDQTEMMALLPQNIAQSADFTPKAKLLLSELIFRNGMDKVADDGYFFATNSDLMEASGYGNKQVAVTINKFVKLGFINRKTGKYKGNASEYIVDMEKIENYESSKGVVKGCSPKSVVSELKGVVKGCSPKGVVSEKYTLSENAAIEQLTLAINELRNEINDLKGVVSDLKGVVKGCSLKGVVSKKYTTDTDTDTESDTETSMYVNENETVSDDGNSQQGEVADKVETISVQVEEDTDATSVRPQIDDNSVEDKEATAKVKLSHDEITKRNDYISAVYRKVDERLNYLYTLKTYSLYVDVCTEIANVITDAQEHGDWFTEPQWDKLTRYCERFVKITEAKDNYFNGTMKRGADANTTSTDDNAAGANFNDSSVDSTNNNPVPAPTDWAKVGAWVVESMEKFPTYEAWQKELDRILNKKFGVGWENADYKTMAQASAIYNRCTKTALEHYASIENAQKTTPTPTEEDADLAPWETPFNHTYTTEATQVAPDSVSDVEPTNSTTDNNEALRTDLNELDVAEPDDEDYAFDEYISMTTVNRSIANYGYAYGV